MQWLQSEQLVLQFRVDDFIGGKCIFQRVAGDLPEIDMRPHQRSQPGVFQLLLTPEAGQGVRLVAQVVAATSRGGMDVEKRAVSVEYARADAANPL